MQCAPFIELVRVFRGLHSRCAISSRFCGLSHSTHLVHPTSRAAPEVSCDTPRRPRVQPARLRLSCSAHATSSVCARGCRDPAPQCFRSALYNAARRRSGGSTFAPALARAAACVRRPRRFDSALANGLSVIESAGGARSVRLLYVSGCAVGGTIWVRPCGCAFTKCARSLYFVILNSLRQSITCSPLASPHINP